VKVAVLEGESWKKKASRGLYLLLPSWGAALRLCGCRRQTVPSDDDVQNAVAA